MRTIDEQILQDWIPTGQIETRFFNYENMIAFAKHYEKEGQGQKLPISDVNKTKIKSCNQYLLHNDCPMYRTEGRKACIGCDAAI